MGPSGHGSGVQHARLMQPAYYDSSDESDVGGQPARGDPTEGSNEAHGSFLQGAWQPYTNRAVSCNGASFDSTCVDSWGLRLFLASAEQSA